MAPSTQPIPPELLKHVECPALKNGKPVMETKKRRGEDVEVAVTRDVEPSEVVRWVVRDDVVHVVTDQGRKYSGRAPKGWTPPADEAAA